MHHRSRSLPTIALVWALALAGGCSGFETVADGGGSGDAAGDTGVGDGPLSDGPRSDRGDLGPPSCPGPPFSELAGEAVEQSASADTAVAFDPKDGALHLVFFAQATAEDRVLYMRRDQSGTWSAPERLSPTGSGADKPLIAIAPGGIVHAVWGDKSSGTAYHRARQPVGGVWSTRVEVPKSLRGQGDMLVDDAGTLHLVIAEAKDVRYHRLASGAWSAGLTIEDKAPFRSRRVGLALDAARVYAAYCDAAGAIVLQSATLAGDFGSSRQVLASGLDADTCGAHIAVDRDKQSTLHVVYGESPSPTAGTLRHVAGKLGATFSPPTLLGQAKSHTLDFGGYQLVLESGRLHLVTASPSGKLRVFSGNGSDGKWKPPVDTGWAAGFGVAAAFEAGGSALHISHWDPGGHRPRHTTFCP